VLGEVSGWSEVVRGDAVVGGGDASQFFVLVTLLLQSQHR